MARLIDADALIVATENFCDRYKVHWTDKKVLAWIDHAPTIDAVEVVRCGECSKKLTEKCALHCGQLNGTNFFVKRDDNFFCSDGERRESDG